MKGEIKYKTCSACFISKEATRDNFYVRNDGCSRDGFHSICIECRKSGKRSRSRELLFKEIEGIEYKRCTRCGDWFELNDNNFFIDKNNKSSSYCKICNNEVKLAWSKNNSLRTILSKAYGRIKRINKKVDFDLNYLLSLYEEQKGICAISFLPMTHVVGKGKISTNVSIDRIDSTKSYSKNNIQLIQNIVNIMKSDQTQEDFINLCKIISDVNNLP